MSDIGILGNIFKKKDKNKNVQPKINFFNLGANTFNRKTANAYDNYQIRRATNKIAEMIASTPIKHYSEDNEGMIVDDRKSQLSWILQHQANPRLTSFSFFKWMIVRCLMYNDSFAWINRDIRTGELISLEPILATSYNLLSLKEYPEYLYIDFTLNDGVHKVLPIEDVLHFTGDFGSNEYFGDNNKPLIEVVNINDDLWNNLVVWTKDNNIIKGFLKTDAILSEEDSEQAKKDFQEMLQSNYSSYMTLDGKFDYIPANNKSSPMDINYIDKIESSITRFYGLSTKLLEGTATQAELQTFHKVVLEPIFTMMEQEMESKLLTKKQILGFKHRIVFECSNFEHMTPTEKNAAWTLLTNLGVVTGNEVRNGYGFSRVKGLDTYKYSKNFAEVGKTDETSDTNKDEEEKPKEEENKDEEKEENEKDEEDTAKK